MIKNKIHSLIAFGVLILFIVASFPISAEPTGGVIIGGSGKIDQDRLTTTIQQHSSSLAINWDSYNLSKQEIVNYLQPGASSIALNRILDLNGSEIQGRINANGHVILVNPNGLFFGQNATVNVGGLIASGLDISPSDFMNRMYIFNEVLGTQGSVNNSGLINASLGGSVALLGKSVINNSVISAHLGSVSLAAGKAAVLTFDHQGLLGLKITEAVLQDELGIEPAILNSGEISNQGGRVLLTASTSQDVFTQAVNPGEIEQASSVVVHEDGTFTLGGGADVLNVGKIDLSSDDIGKPAGQVVILGENVTSSGVITANANEGNGGQIEIHGRVTSQLTSNSLTTASSESQGHGGIIKVLGKNIGLFDDSLIDASGAEGGGEILVGGDQQGLNESIPNAEFLYVGKDTQINTNASLTGNGGKLITFATDTARIFGQLSSQGGRLDGNGGFIETSGLKGFEILRTPNISAQNGLHGEWLIDPNNINIVSGSGFTNIFQSDPPNPPTNPFTTTDDSAELGVDLIVDALTGGATVTISTTSAGTNSELGNISLIDTDINYNGVGNSTLIFNASNDIVIIGRDIRDNNTGSGSDSLNLNLIAGNNIGITNSNFDTNGGVFVTSGVDFTLTRGGSSANTIDTDGGDVILNMTGDINIGAEIITNGGNFEVLSSFSFNNNNSNGDIATSSDNGGGNITITSLGDVTLGSLNTSDSNGGTPSQYASILVNSGGSISLEQAYDFDDTYGNNNGSEQATELTFNADNDINLNASIFDNVGGAIDTQNITLNSDNDFNGLGDINVNADIYTGGGNVSVSGHSFNSSGSEINTDLSDSGESNSTSSGGDIMLTMRGDVTLGNIVTDTVSTCGSGSDPCGNLSISSDGQINLNASSTISTSGGNVTFNSPILLLQSDNSIDAGNGNIDFTALLDGSTDRGQNLTLTANNIDFNGNVGGNTRLGALSITATGDVNAANNSISTDSTTVLSSNSFNSGAVDTQGAAAATNSNGNNGGDVTINSGDIIIGDVLAQGSAANGTATSGGNGGAITLISMDNSSNGDPSITLNGDINTVGGTGTNPGSAGNVNLTLAGSDNPTGTLILTFSTNFSSAITVNGSIGSDTIFSASRTNSWDNIDAGSGVLNSNLTFNLFENLIGNSGADTFTFIGAGLIDGLVDGGVGVDVANLPAADTTVQIGALAGNTGNSILEVNNIENLIAQAGNTNRLFGENVSVNWYINDFGSGSVGGNAITVTPTEGAVMFTNFDYLSGGAATDTLVGPGIDTLWTIDTTNYLLDTNTPTNFNIEFDGMENLTAGSGDDSFNFIGNGDITGVINAGEGFDIIDLSNNDVVTFDLADALTGRVNFESVTGNSNNISNPNDSTLIAGNNPNIWAITGQDSGVLNNGAPDQLIFSGFNNLIGGTDNDNFNFTATGEIDGLIDGNGNAGIGLDIIDLTAKTTAVFIQESNAGIDNNSILEFINIQQVDATFNSGNIIYSNAALSSNFWVLDGNQTGVLNNTLRFNGFSTLAGLDDVDDVFTLNSGAVNFDFRGGDGTGDDQLINNKVFDVAWNLTAANQGQIVDLDGSNIFSGIENLLGSSNADNFSLQGGSISGTVDGGSGSANDAIINDQFIAFDWTITGINQGNVIGISNFTGIENLIGAANVSDTFYLVTGGITGLIDGGMGSGAGSNSIINQQTSTTVWNITGNNQGDVGGIANFINIENLTGAIGVIDEFHLVSGGITGILDAASGVGDLLINELTSATTWNITGNNQGNVTGINNFIGVENLTGSNTQVDTFNLIAGNISGIVSGGTNTTDEIVNQLGTTTDWNISDVNTGSVANTDFTDIENLTGGTLDDTFIYTNGGDISGLIDGGLQASADELDFSRVDDVSLNLLTDMITNIEQVIGNGNNSTLIASNSDNSWTIDGTNSGTLGLLDFVDFNNLTGGAGQDTFNVMASGSVLGQVQGLQGDDFVNLYLSNSIQSGLFTFDGGDDMDVIVINGGNSNTAVLYENLGAGIERLTYSDNPNVYVLTFSQTESISDTVTATAFSINGTGTDDVFNLGSNRFDVNAGTDIVFSNKANVLFDGLTGNDLLTVYENVALTGELSVTAVSIADANNAVLTVDVLSLDMVDQAGDVNDYFNTNLTTLNLQNISGDLYIQNATDVIINQFGNITGSLDLVADMGSISNAVDFNGAADVSLTALSGDVNLNNVLLLNSFDVSANAISIDNGANALSVDNLNASSTVTLSSIGLTLNGDLTSAGDTSLSSDTGNVSLNGDLNLSNAASLNVSGDAISQSGSIASQDGNVVLLATDGITMNASSQTVSTNGSITYQAESDVQLTLLQSQSGDITVNTNTGRITDGFNSGAINIQGSTLNMLAATGIGTGSNALDTRVDQMNVVNTTSGVIDINQTGEVDLLALQHTVNGGSITFESNDDIYFSPGSVVVSRNDGEVLMTTATNFFGFDFNPDNPNNPDVTAFNAIFLAPSGTFGTTIRPILMDVPEGGSVLIDAATSSVRFYPEKPVDLTTTGIDISTLGISSSLAGEQSVVVESLSDVDPAIFTALKNYSLEEIAIQLPRDQLFEDELEENNRRF